MGIHRNGLIARRNVLLARYHTTIEAADLDVSERAAEGADWEARVIALFGNDVYELRELISAIERCDRGTYDHCVTCGGALPDDSLAMLPTQPRCSDCAITQVMTAMA